MKKNLVKKLFLLLFLLFFVIIIANLYPKFSIILSTLLLIWSTGFLIYQKIAKKLVKNNFLKGYNLYGFIVFLTSFFLVIASIFVIQNQNNLKKEAFLKKVFKLEEARKKEKEIDDKNVFEVKLISAHILISKKKFEEAFLTYKEAMSLNKIDKKEEGIFINVVLEIIKKNLLEKEYSKAKANLKIITDISPDNKIASDYIKEISIEEKKIEENEDLRKSIFYELAKLQDQGGNDPQNSENAQYIIAERYGVTRDEVLKIMVEGVKNDWPIPDSPN